MNNYKNRMSGVLAHPTSFPSKYGIGDLGKASYNFIDFLVESNQTLWQILPIGPTGYGDSPYQSFSSFAGQTLIISPDKLLEDDLLKDDDLTNVPVWFNDKIDYGYVIYYKSGLFKKAFSNFLELDANHRLTALYRDFCNSNNWWLNDFALYSAIKDSYDGRSWLEWDDEIRTPSNDTKAVYTDKMSSSIDYYKFLQFIFYKQWKTLKDYANKHNIFIVGDIPIFVALDGSDTWANQNLFQLDEKGFPLAVSGVPPDYFSSTGQLWGNPLYDWNELKNTNYDWWIRRVKHQLQLVDYLRVDHFRGFEAYWAVPYEDTTAINGSWQQGPCHDFFYALQRELGENMPIWAEDLGVITPEVENLRDTFALPGMKILQFGFENMEDNYFLPHNYPTNCICYPGTHDNNTFMGWYNNAPSHIKDRTKEYLNCSDTDVVWSSIRAALSSTAKYTIIPLQDILEIETSGRMNTPGLPNGNWSWRFLDKSLNKNIADKLAHLTRLFGR